MIKYININNIMIVINAYNFVNMLGSMLMIKKYVKKINAKKIRIQYITMLMIPKNVLIQQKDAQMYMEINIYRTTKNTNVC